MAKAKESRKPPSRKRYEEENPVIGGRVDRETASHFKEHLQATGCSYRDFIKDALEGRETMTEKQVEMLASRRMNPLLEDRVRCLEDLIHQVYLLTVDTDECPPQCPHCEDEELCMCEGREMEPKQARRWVLTWKCPKCGFFLDTYKRIDPKSMKWVDPENWQRIEKAKVSAECKPRKRKQRRDQVKDNK